MAGWKCFALALVALVALPSAMADVNAIIADCEDKMDALVDRYENATLATPTCDATCLASCYSTLEAAFSISMSADPAVSSCPDQASIIKCLNVFEAEWKAYATECAVTTVLEEIHEAADAEAAEAAEAAAGPAAGPAEAEAEAAAPSPAEAEAEAEAEAAVPVVVAAPAEAESEAGEGTRRLMAEAESEAESEAGAAKSCFPQINTVEDFDKYLSGELVLEAAAATTSGAAATRVAVGAAAAVLALAAF